MAAVLGAGVKPTRGFLLQLKRRVVFIEEGYKLLELKRDELANQLRANLEELTAKKKRQLEVKIESVLRKLAVAYASVGSKVMSSQVASIEGSLDLEVLPKSVMGIPIPYLKIQRKPSTADKLGFISRSVAHEFCRLIEELLEVAELESRIERIADELERTNRKVNALEKIVIPEYRLVVKQIEDRLDQDMLEEFIRTRFVRSLISRKKAYA